MSDHALTVISLVVGVAGVAAGFLTSFYFYLKAREKIDPRYLLSFQPLVSQSSGAMKDVSVLYNDKKATNLNRCVLLIWNRGRKAIANDSVAERDRVRVRFPDGAKALGVGIRKSSRDAINLSALVDDDGSSVTINFDFLDQGDGGAIEILSQGDPLLSPSSPVRSWERLAAYAALEDHRFISIMTRMTKVTMKRELHLRGKPVWRSW